MCKLIILKYKTEVAPRAKPQMANRQGSLWLIDSSTFIHLGITHPAKIFSKIVTSPYSHSFYIISRFFIPFRRKN